MATEHELRERLATLVHWLAMERETELHGARRGQLKFLEVSCRDAVYRLDHAKMHAMPSALRDVARLVARGESVMHGPDDEHKGPSAASPSEHPRQQTNREG